MEVSFAESIEQYGLGGFLVLLLLSGAVAALSNSLVRLWEAKLKKEKGFEFWLRPLVAAAATAILLGYAYHMINAKRDNLRQAASLLDGKWTLTGDCRFVTELSVNIAAGTLSARQPDDFTLTYEIDYVRPNSVQVHARGDGDNRLFERVGNALAQRDFDGQKVSLTKC